MRSMAEGSFTDSERAPSTALRAVPLPEKSRGGIKALPMLYAFFTLSPA
jgi:hypothetical protein